LEEEIRRIGRGWRIGAVVPQLAAHCHIC